MPSEKLYREFQHLERKIQLMLSENSRLKNELAQSVSDNQMLKAKLDSQQADLNSVQNTLNINKLVDNMTVGERDSAELKVQIDGYIQEIDRCIAHLAE